VLPGEFVWLVAAPMLGIDSWWLGDVAVVASGKQLIVPLFYSSRRISKQQQQQSLIWQLPAPF
jgi:hypothetical protein